MERHVRITLTLFKNSALFYPGADRDPFVTGLDHLLKVMVRNDLGRQFRTRSENHAAPLSSTHSALLNMTHAFVPPKPNEFESTTLRSALRASLGT